MSWSSNCFLTHQFARFSPADYFLFLNFKKWLGGERFANNEVVESSVNGYFEELDCSYYNQEEIEAIKNRWE